MIEFTEEDRKLLGTVAADLGERASIARYQSEAYAFRVKAEFLRRLAERPAGDAEGSVTLWREERQSLDELIALLREERDDAAAEVKRLREWLTAEQVSSGLSLEDIEKLLIEKVGAKIDWNLNAYGVAATGEEEDVEFLISDAAKAVHALLADRSPSQPAGADEDCDDLCSCGHERFAHDDGREMGAEGTCKASGCTCPQFRSPAPAGEAGHRVEIDFDSGSPPAVRLIHPETGCPTGEEDDACYLTDWLDNEGVELLRGKLTLPVRWEQAPASDHPLFHLSVPTDVGEVDRG